MLDRYWTGATNRISPEAPVAVMLKKQAEDRLGGAANVALNLAKLGVHTHLTGLIGTDPEGQSLLRLLEKQSIPHSCTQLSDTTTITKLRVISHNQQLLRIDAEEKFNLQQQSAAQKDAEKLLKHCDGFILSDYGKGSFDNPQTLIQLAKKNNTKVFIDPKGVDFNKYRGATLITPNFNEFTAVAGPCESDEEIFAKAEAMRKDLALDAIVITMSERGMALVEKNATPRRLPTRAREVYDVTGAGDTVIATIAAGMSSNLSLYESAQLANITASIVLGKLGTAYASLDELQEELAAANKETIKGLLEEVKLIERVQQAKKDGHRIVMTNGCFDLLHTGHIHYLNEAAALGDRLIVAINSDSSVKRLKGEQRPINTLKDRITMLCALKSVDWVVVFEEDTPQRLISATLPDVLVKGGDYRAEDIAGYKEVNENGGEVKILSFLQGHSSTALIDKIRRSD